ncbi:MAG: hypothetical protein AVDCRST_MAG76-827 [uncultured Acidimicrobiales bacterium]|uniref:Anti-sigma factor n=1 Tax=uncultured Acidimicrobiales bacterium TaxID=310071 RepID=A0A6J4HGQ1_9ACTN|nr:MAG: hypothetical protein AVDCRST_MAG76-827 [uncultured Acidimicrobiales bacterium]
MAERQSVEGQSAEGQNAEGQNAEGQSIGQLIGPVELTVPARSEHLRVMRLVATSVAASLDLDVDQLDDLRIAIDDLCSMLIEDAPSEAKLHLSLQGRLGHLVAEGSVTGGRCGASIDPISQLILDGLDLEWSNDEERACFHVVAPRQGVK